MGLYKGHNLITPSKYSQGGGGETDYKIIDGTITSVTIPNNVTYVRDYAFYGCSNLSSVIMSNNITVIGDHAFDGTIINTISISNSITTIDENAFANCSNLEKIHIDKEYGTIVNAPWGATNATVIWNDMLDGEVDLTDYSFEKINGNIVMTRYNGDDTSVSLPDVI